MPISDLTGPVTSVGSATAIADGAIGVAKISGLGTLATLNAAPAGTLTGNTLAAGVTASSLTSVGTLGALTVTAPINGSVTGNAGTVTTNANLTGPITSVGNATSVAAQTGTGSTFVMQASPTLTTPTIGVAIATSVAHAGTAGAGFASFVSQSSNSAAPASGFSLFADSTGRFSWIRQSDGFVRSFAGTLTADRVYTLPDASTTFAGLSVAQTFSATQTFATVVASGNILLRSAGAQVTLGVSDDVILSRAAAANLKQGASVDSATPVAQTFSVQNVIAGTSNTAGVDRTYAGSASTGDQVGGGHIFKTTPPGSSGTTQNAQVTAFTITGLGTALTTASTTARSGLRIPSGTAPTSPTSGDFWYDGTNLKFQDGATTRTLTWT